MPTREEMKSILFNCVKPVPFEEYKEMFKDWFILKREDGIIEVQMHTNGGPGLWTYGMHKGLGMLPKIIAQDNENGVMIITGTNDVWLTFAGMEYGEILIESAAKNPQEYARRTYDEWYMDGKELLKAYLFDLQIPTIAVLNGPSPIGHTEFALACDLTLCTPDFAFKEGHFGIGLVPGDGQFLALRHILGEKRANMMAYDDMQINAEKALEWGLVNEVVPREKIMQRAWELARKIMKQDYHTRRLTHHVMTDPWRRDVLADFDMQFACEGWAASMKSPAKGLKEIEEKHMDKK